MHHFAYQMYSFIKLMNKGSDPIKTRLKSFREKKSDKNIFYEIDLQLKVDNKKIVSSNRWKFSTF